MLQHKAVSWSFYRSRKSCDWWRCVRGGWQQSGELVLSASHAVWWHSGWWKVRSAKSMHPKEKLVLVWASEWFICWAQSCQVRHRERQQKDIALRGMKMAWEGWLQTLIFSIVLSVLLVTHAVGLQVFEKQLGTFSNSQVKPERRACQLLHPVVSSHCKWSPECVPGWCPAAQLIYKWKRVEGSVWGGARRSRGGGRTLRRDTFSSLGFKSPSFFFVVVFVKPLSSLEI